MAEETFGRLVARLRRERHMTQAKLAARLHVTDKAVSKWERGAACPEISTLPRLADALGVHACALLSAIDPRGAAVPEDEADAPVSARRNAKWRRRMALRYAGKALLFAAIAVLTVMNLYAGYVFDWLMGNTMTFAYPYFVLLIIRHLLAACALICAAILRLGRGRARWLPIAVGFAALSALCTAGVAAGWIMMFPAEAYWYDWLNAAAHTFAAALTIASLFLRRRALPAAGVLLCAAGLCVGAALLVAGVSTPYFTPADYLLSTLARSLELGAPLFLLALCLPAEAKYAAFDPDGKPRNPSAAPLG